MSRRIIKIPVPDHLEWRGEVRRVEHLEHYMNAQGEVFRWKGPSSSSEFYILYPRQSHVENWFCNVTVKDIYGDLPPLLEGYEDIGLSVRPMKDATHWVSKNGDLVPIGSSQAKELGPVIWLKRVEE